MSQCVQGDHVCCVYQDHEEHVNRVFQFCNEGLTNNNKVLCLLADQQMVSSVLKNDYAVLRSSEIVEKLRESGNDVDSFIAKGQLEFYFPSSFIHSGELLLEKVIEHLAQKVSEENSAKLWLYSDPLFYVLSYHYNSQGTLSFHDFENSLNIQFSQCTIMCCYDKTLYSTPFLQRAFATHPIIATNKKLYSKNFYYQQDFDSLDFSEPCVPFYKQQQNEVSENFPSSSVDRWISVLDEWQSMYQSKERKREQADEHSGLTNSFVSNMSHQLHTPLTGILGASYLMATTSLTPEQEEYLAYIVSSAEQLKHVISDILDFKQLGTELTIEKQPVSIRDCLNEALHQSGILTLSASGNPGVTCHIANDVPDYILSDRGRILQIFVNLIHNSMRFSTRDSWGLDVSITNLGFLPPSPPSTPPSSLSPSPSSIPSSSVTPSYSTISAISPNSSISTSSPTITLTTSTLPSFTTPALSTQPLIHIPSLSSTTTSIEPTPISPLSPPEPSISSTHSSSETNLPTLPSSSLTQPTFPIITPSISPSLTTSPSIPKLRFVPPRIIPPPYPYSLPSPNLSPLSVVGMRTPGLRCLLRITVRDNGKGMEPSALLDVFHPDNSLSRIKHILELLGGDISIESEGTGKGTTATITLKAEIWTPPSSPTPQSPSLLSSLASLSPSSLLLSRHVPPRVRSLPLHSSLSSPSLSSSATLPSSSSSSLSPRTKIIPGIYKGLSVLLVEDNLMNQKVLRRLFGKLGIQPDVASHGAQAVEYVRNKKYDIVFMDLHMPVCDGFEATRQIQQLPPSIHKPQIYALTASVSSEDKDKCLSLGMQGHLPKPVSVQALVDALSSVNIS